MQNAPISNVRLATLDQLLKTLIPAFLDPVPCRATLRNWFDANKVPRVKANPCAKRGGGLVFYSVPHVEKLFRSRMLPGRLSMEGTR